MKKIDCLALLLAGADGEEQRAYVANEAMSYFVKKKYVVQIAEGEYRITDKVAKQLQKKFRITIL